MPGAGMCATVALKEGNMSDERQRVLKMLEEGQITADEAAGLLEVLPAGEEVGEATITTQPTPFGDSPDMERFRRFWQIPFSVAVFVLVLSGLGVASAYHATGGRITFWVVCVTGIFLLAMAAAALAFATRTARWVHVRVREKGGRHIAISLPLPLVLADWGIGIARRYVDSDEVMHLDTAATLIREMREDPSMWDEGPMLVEVHDEDGDHVQVFLG